MQPSGPCDGALFEALPALGGMTSLPPGEGWWPGLLLDCGVL